MNRSKLLVLMFASVAAIAIALASCDFPQPKLHGDARQADGDAPSPTHTCVLDTDAFDQGCTLNP